MAITINVNLDEILAALKDDLDFTGNADKYIKVNATADGFEFAAVSGGGGGTWGSITGTLSDQTDLQSALDLKANLAGASFTGDVSVTTIGSGDTLQLTNSGSGTTLNLLNSGSGDFLTIDSTKLVIDNGGDVSIGTATASARFHVLTGSTSKVGAIIQAAAGQTANLLEVNSNGGSGGNLFRVEDDGYMASTGGLFYNSAGTYVRIRAGASNNTSAGTTPILSFRNASDTQVAFVRSDGLMASTFYSTSDDTSVALVDSTLATAAYPRGLNMGSLSIVSWSSAAWWQSKDVGLSRISAGVLGIGNGTQGNTSGKLSLGAISLTSGTTSSIPLTLTAAAGQTANLLEVKNSGGTNLFHITASGGIATNGNAGFTGTGIYTNLTIENGIITAAS